MVGQCRDGESLRRKTQDRFALFLTTRVAQVISLINSQADVPRRAALTTRPLRRFGSPVERRPEESASVRWSGRLDSDAPRVIDAAEQYSVGSLQEVLVRRLPRAAPKAVIVDDEHAAHGQPRIEMHELMLGRFIPVGVETQQRDPLRRGAPAMSPRPCPCNTR